jgi:drug/metabolite transporter (DMT)-like permease
VEKMFNAKNNAQPLLPQVQQQGKPRIALLQGNSMQSLLYGLIAALSWGLHDYCVRHLSQRLSSATMLFAGLCAGSLVLLLVILSTGGWVPITPQVAMFGLASGVCYAFACVGLYKAFAIGPVRLVAPICGAYPVLSFALAAITGQPITIGQWLAALAVIAGIALVARQSEPDADTTGRSAAMAWAALGAVGFALTFALGQTAVHGAGQQASQAWAELPITLLSRFAAILLIGAWVMRGRLPLAPLRPYLPLLALMGVLDVTALSFVLAAGGLANPEFAAVSSSLFGLVTILLAWRFLRERMQPLQWVGVGLVFSGIGWLAAS